MDAATLPAEPEVPSTAKQSRKRKTEQKKATDKKKVDGRTAQLIVNKNHNLDSYIHTISFLNDGSSLACYATSKAKQYT